MDFSNIDGYKFEELVASLLRKMDFSVEQTSLSGDGGVDIIAINNRPIYKGKYLIQCKNWIKPVGQPEIRDLFGVVTSEHANKGIIITTSYFTDQAIQFAHNKNIELIDHDALINLLNQYQISKDFIRDMSDKTLHFTSMGNFDTDKYTYLKTKIEDNYTEKMYYDNLRKFFHSYILSNLHEINMSGLIDEYIELNNEIIKRFCKKSKLAIAEAKTYRFINTFLYLLKGDIFRVIETYKDLGMLKPSYNICFSPTWYQERHIFFKHELEALHNEVIISRYGNEVIIKTDYCSSPLVAIKNLYLLFYKLEYKEGIDFIDTLRMRNFKRVENSPSIINTPTNEAIKEFKKKEFQEVFERIRNNTYNKIHIPTESSVYKGHNDYELITKFKEDVYISVEDLLKIYYKNITEKVYCELDRVKILFEVNEL